MSKNEVAIKRKVCIADENIGMASSQKIAIYVKCISIAGNDILAIIDDHLTWIDRRRVHVCASWPGAYPNIQSRVLSGNPYQFCDRAGDIGGINVSLWRD